MSYFDSSLYVISDFTTARGSDINTPMSAIEVAFDNVELEISGVKRIYAEDTGAANSIIVDAGPSVTTYSDGLQLTVNINVTNTGATTINVNSMGVQNVKRFDLSVLQAGDIIADGVFVMVYNGTEFIIVSYMPSFIAEAETHSDLAESWADDAAASATLASTYKDFYTNDGSVTGAVSLDCNTYRSFQINMTGNVTLTFDTSTLDANDTYVIELFVTRTGAYDITYTDSVDWPYQTKPAMDTTTTNTTYQFMFVIVKGVFIKAYLISADI